MERCASEAPVEGYGAGVVADLESEESVFEGCEIGEVLWFDDLALND